MQTKGEEKSPLKLTQRNSYSQRRARRCPRHAMPAEKKADKTTGRPHRIDMRDNQRISTVPNFVSIVPHVQSASWVFDDSDNNT